jgi:hypothetical protein
MGTGSSSAKGGRDRRKQLEEQRDTLDVSIRALKAALSPQNCKSRDEALKLSRRLALATKQRQTIDGQIDQIDAVRTNATVLEGKAVVQIATMNAAKRIENLDRHMVTKDKAAKSAARVARVVRNLNTSTDAVDELVGAISEAAEDAIEEANGGGDDEKQDEAVNELMAQWDDARELGLPPVPLPRDLSPVHADGALDHPAPVVGDESVARQDDKKQ